MSIGSIFAAGLSGLQASQTGMRVASQNIANANTAGYVRTEITLSPLNYLGAGAGVEVSAVRRAADKFLATAAYIAEANNGAASARSTLLARAQVYFGDPNSASSVFSAIDDIWSSMTELQVDPSSTLVRDEVVSAISTAFNVLGQTANSIQSLIAEADERIGDAVNELQSLLDRVAELNDEIRFTMRAGGDASGVENTQGALIDQIAKLIDVRVEGVNDGGVILRTSGGALLVGAEAAQLSYTPSGAAFATHGVISFNAHLGAAANLEPYILGGEIAGLLQARDVDLPAIAEALGGFAGALADKLNEAHNQNSSTPAVSTLTGRQTGLLGADALNFTGQARLAVVDSDGDLVQRLLIDFDAGQITGEAPAGPYSFAAGDIDALTAALNSALGDVTPAGAASFTDGVLSLSVSNGGGLVVQDVEGAESDRAGRGFSHFFGLNDIVGRPSPLFFDTGLEGADAHGFAQDGALTFLVRDANGRFTAERTLTITAGMAAGSLDDLITALNATGTGVGEYATFALGTDGRLTMTPRAGFETTITSDTTERGGTGVSFSGLFGLTAAATGGRAFETGVTSAILNDPDRLAVGSPDLVDTALGDRIIELGDNRGAARLSAVRDTTYAFEAAGALSAQSTTLGLYSSRLGGVAGRLANDANNAARGAAAVSAAAIDRRAQVEGVTIDDELLRMTAYQNSYAAAARVIQAAQDMLDILLSIGR